MFGECLKSLRSLGRLDPPNPLEKGELENEGELGKRGNWRERGNQKEGELDFNS